MRMRRNHLFRFDGLFGLDLTILFIACHRVLIRPRKKKKMSPVRRRVSAVVPETSGGQNYYDCLGPPKIEIDDKHFSNPSSYTKRQHIPELERHQTILVLVGPPKTATATLQNP
jgi:hypothetical protein